MKDVLGQLARSGLLLPDISAKILAGDAPPLEELALALIVTSLDAHVVTIAAPTSSWNDKRQARMALAAVFLAAMAVLSRPSNLTRS
jgi:hypothetical protein